MYYTLFLVSKTFEVMTANSVYNRLASFIKLLFVHHRSRMSHCHSVLGTTRSEQISPLYQNQKIYGLTHLISFIKFFSFIQYFLVLILHYFQTTLFTLAIFYREQNHLQSQIAYCPYSLALLNKIFIFWVNQPSAHLLYNFIVQLSSYLFIEFSFINLLSFSVITGLLIIC